MKYNTTIADGNASLSIISGEVLTPNVVDYLLRLGDKNDYEVEVKNRNESTLTGKVIQYLPESDQVVLLCTSIHLKGEPTPHVYNTEVKDTRPRTEVKFAA